MDGSKVKLLDSSHVESPTTFWEDKLPCVLGGGSLIYSTAWKVQFIYLSPEPVHNIILLWTGTKHGKIYWAKRCIIWSVAIITIFSCHLQTANTQRSIHRQQTQTLQPPSHAVYLCQHFVFSHVTVSDNQLGVHGWSGSLPTPLAQTNPERDEITRQLRVL